MTTHPIYRVRRLALAARLTAGDELSAYDYRRAALEPFDERVPFEPLDQRDQAAADAANKRPTRLPPGPSF